MADKSPGKAKKPGKSIKEKRAEKRATEASASPVDKIAATKKK